MTHIRTAILPLLGFSLLANVSIAQVFQPQPQPQPQALNSATRNEITTDILTRIRSKIRRYMVVSPGVPTTAMAEFVITLSTDGHVQRVKLVKPSGYEQYDKALERAIFMAQPLPLPADPSLFNKFRELHLKFSHPE